MEGKNMRVLVQTIMLLLMVALVAGQPGSNSPPVPQTPPANGLVPPAIPGSDQLPPGSGMLPPGAGMLPPGAGMLPPGGGMLPPGAGLLPPIMPGDGVVPPLIPGDGIIPPFIPGIGGIDLPKRKCAGQCALQCMRSKRNRFASKICTSLCMLRCGIRMSNVVYSCTKNCAHSMSPNSISGTHFFHIAFHSNTKGTHNLLSKFVLFVLQIYD